MTSAREQLGIEHPVSLDPTGYRVATRSASDPEKFVESGLGRESFRHTDWANGITRTRYSDFLSTLSVMQRESLYKDVLKEVLAGALTTKCLLAFASFDPHRKLVCAAVKDYLTNRNCNIDDEFAGVHELIEILGDDGTANRGAILAGLVSVGDRRINAVARAARHLLSGDDVKNFCGVHLPELRSSSVEFCLDWLIELNQSGCKDYLNDIACALMLMVVHDDRGVVEDLSEIEYVGFKKTKILQTKTFEHYYGEIRPILNYLEKCDGFKSVIGRVIKMWDEHRDKAHLLRRK